MDLKEPSNHHFRDLAPDHIKKMVNSVVFLMDYDVVSHRQPATTQFDYVQLGMIDVFRYEGFGLRRSNRRTRHIVSDKVDDFFICTPMRGSIDLQQDGRRAIVHPGEFAVMSTVMPYSATIATSGMNDSFSCFQARVPGSVLQARVPSIHAACDRPIQIARGANTIMRSLLELAVREGAHLPAHQASQLGTILMEMVACSVLGASELPLHQEPSSKVSWERIAERAKVYIESQLSDPSLDVAMIANHCHVSLRTLQAIFASTSQTVAGYIRKRRLLRCRDALQTCTHLDKPITRVALMWGFNDMAYFSRAYKAQFGLTPSKDQGAALRRRSRT